MVLLEVIIQVYVQEFEHYADVVKMGETFICSYKIELLCIHFTQSRQNIDFHLSLLAIRWQILQDLHSHNFIRIFLPALEHLPKSSSTYRIYIESVNVSDINQKSHPVLLSPTSTSYTQWTYLTIPILHSNCGERI